MMQKQDVIVPSGMVDYQCSQSGECCGGWDIGLDKESHDRLKFILNKNHKKKAFKKAVTVMKETDKSSYYSMINFQDGYCSFLDSNQLCSVHKNYSIDAMPDICKVFPRLVYHTPFGKELSMTFSCPSAAKLLKKKEKIVKVKNPKNFFFAHGNLAYGRITSDIFKRNDIRKFYFEIEDHIIEILQCRKFTIEERLILLGLTMKRLEVLENPDFSQVEDNFKLNRQIMSHDFLKDNAKKINPSITHQVYLLKEFVNLRIPQVPGEELKELFTYLSKLFYFDQDDDKLQMSVDFYTEQYHKIFLPEEEKVRHIFENFLVYLTLRKYFVIYNFKNAYFLLIYFFSLVRLTAIGLCIRDNKPMDEDIVIKAVWAIEKAIGHSYQFYNTILFYLEDQNQTTVSHSITLLKMPETQGENILQKT